MPKSQRARWAPPRRKRHVANDSESADGVADTDKSVQGQPDLVEMEAEPALSLSGLKAMVLSLWRPSYESLFEEEIATNRAALGRPGGFGVLQLTRYARSLKGEKLAAWQRRQLNRERDQMAIELHALNMRHWSPSMLARSVAYFSLTTSWLHQVESGQRRLASRPMTFKVLRCARSQSLQVHARACARTRARHTHTPTGPPFSTSRLLRMMRDCRPKPDWAEGQHVSCYAFDQTYEWVGMAKRGRRQAVEHVDAAGMPMAITHEVYVNSVKVRLPSVLGTLSPADLLAIQNNHGSPYTEDYNLLFDWLRPRAIQSYLRDFASDALASVQRAALVVGQQPASLSLRQIAESLYGRRQVDPGGPSEFDILEPIMSCDTKSYKDGVKIATHLTSHSPATTAVDIIYGDGQSVILLKNLKARWPRLYARMLVAVGGFHEHAHTMFGLNEMFFDCLVCWCLKIIGITKVFKVTKDLEHNNYAHVQQVHH